MLPLSSVLLCLLFIFVFLCINVIIIFETFIPFFLPFVCIYIYIYIYIFAELDYLVEDIYCYSEFHAPCGAIIRQLLKITDTYEDIQNLKIQNNA